MKKNKLFQKLIPPLNKWLPIGILLAEDAHKKDKVVTRYAKSRFHQSEKYACGQFYKPISKIRKPTNHG